MTNSSANFAAEFQNTPKAAASMLQECAAFIRKQFDTSGHIEVALSEALNNIVDHAYSRDGKGKVHIQYKANSILECKVSDTGNGFQTPRRVPSLEGERGRGLFIMEGFSDLFEVKTSLSGTQVTMLFLSIPSGQTRQ